MRVTDNGLLSSNVFYNMLNGGTMNAMATDPIGLTESSKWKHMTQVNVA